MSSFTSEQTNRACVLSIEEGISYNKIPSEC